MQNLKNYQGKNMEPKIPCIKLYGITTVPHFKEGLCEDCGGSSIGGEL